MARGQSAATGKWNFHVQRHACVNCGKKGMYLTGFRGWIACMYCDLLLTEQYSKEFISARKTMNKPLLP